MKMKMKRLNQRDSACVTVKSKAFLGAKMFFFLNFVFFQLVSQTVSSKPQESNPKTGEVTHLPYLTHEGLSVRWYSGR